MKTPTPRSWFRDAFFKARFVGMAFIDHHTWSIIQCNATFASMLEYDVAELVGMPLQTITHDSDAGRYREALRAVLAGDQEEIDMTKRYVTRTGRAIMIRAVTSPLRYNNEIACMIKQVAPIVDPHAMDERVYLRETVVKLQAQLESVQGNIEAIMSKPDVNQINVGGARVNAGNTDNSTTNDIAFVRALCGLMVVLLMVIAYLIYIAGWPFHRGDADQMHAPKQDTQHGQVD